MEKVEINKANQSSEEERIELFLKGHMASEEAALFRKEIQENEELRKKAISMALLIKGMQKTGGERDKIIINEVRNEKASPNTPKIKYYIRQGLAIAACVCIVFTIYDYHDVKYQTNNLALAYIDSYNPPLPEIDDISRGRGESSCLDQEKQVLTELSEIFSSVRKGENNQACIEDLKPKFELALSRKLNNYTPYLKHIGYYLAIAQLHENDRKAAKETLGILLTETPDFTEAEILLEKINDINYFWE